MIGPRSSSHAASDSETSADAATPSPSPSQRRLARLRAAVVVVVVAGIAAWVLIQAFRGRQVPAPSGRDEPASGGREEPDPGGRQEQHPDPAPLESSAQIPTTGGTSAPDAPTPGEKAAQAAVVPPDHDADPAAVPLAAWTRALVRGDLASARTRAEHSAFPRSESAPWRETLATLDADELQSAWFDALQRILHDERYRDLRRDPLEAPARRDAETRDDPASWARLEKQLIFGRREDLVPLGRDPQSRLEEFAAPATGNVRLRHPETGHLDIRAGDAMVFVLVPGRPEVPADPKTGSAGSPAVLSFLLAKTEATVTQVGAEGATIGTSRNLPWVSADEDLVEPKLPLATTQPTTLQWEHAALVLPADARGGAWSPDTSGGKLHDVARLEPNALGLYDMFGNVAEPTRVVDIVTGLVNVNNFNMRGGSYASDSGLSYAVIGYRPAIDLGGWDIPQAQAPPMAE